MFSKSIEEIKSQKLKEGSRFTRRNRLSYVRGDFCFVLSLEKIPGHRRQLYKDRKREPTNTFTSFEEYRQEQLK